MPNYCYCILIMKGKEKDIQHVKTDIAGIDEEGNIRPIDFHKIIPMPPKLLETYQRNESTAWYDWCIKNWGTKWNTLYDDFQEQNKDPYTIHFTTANNPPIPVIETLAYRYPEIEFSLEYFIESDHKNITTINFIVGEPPNI